jgi:hypothetical protein
MRVEIKGMTQKSTEFVTECIETYNHGDLLAYGMPLSADMDHEMLAADKLLRAMLATDYNYGVTWGNKLCVADTECDLEPEMLSVDFDDPDTLAILIHED